ncbi:MAG: hypothetical protein M3Z30_07860 [Gemmatimonadota bacterium]|nr:hypothetical protein [Gemmatimonadota bacterium]
MSNGTAVSPETVRTMWIVTLAVYSVVVIVVAILLTLILRTARDIRSGVGAIWNVGQRIANNTIHIPLLNKTNSVAACILESAVGIVHASAGIESHARECSGCPACVIGPPWLRGIP